MAQGYAKSAKLGDHGNLDGLTDDDHSFYPKGALGYAQITSNSSSVSADTNVSGLEVTVTVGDSRRIKISADGLLSGSVANDVMLMRIKDDTGGANTTLTYWQDEAHTASNDFAAHPEIVITPSSGTYTYKISIQRLTGTGNVTLKASATRPGWILVEDIGPV